MPNRPVVHHIGRAACLCLALMFFALVPIHAASPNIVISQVYGGGGNSGATLNEDFVELFNRGASPVTITGWSLQYASATGTSGTISSSNLHILSGTIQPGQYFLVGEALGSHTEYTPLPATDLTGTIAMGASAGKIFLVSDSAGLTIGATGCPTNGGSIVDFVGFGTTAVCYEGSAPTGSISVTSSAIRNDACVDTDNNGADFSVVAVAPRNTQTALHTCSVPTPPSAIGHAAPNGVDPGAKSLLTVTVTPGANPASTLITVTGDLTAIGGPASQQFYDDGTNDDFASGDNVFTFHATVGEVIAPGSKSIPINISDHEGRTGSATITLTVNQPPVTTVPIHSIQGSGATSPMVGQTVTTTGIVTAVRSNGFYLEAPDAEQDADPATSEAIYVYGGATGRTVGESVQVTGTVSEYASGALSTTEITSPSVVSLSQSNPAPTAVELSPAAGITIDQLEAYESMLIHMTSPRAVGPTGGSGASDGIFYVRASSVDRPFREPGLNPTAAAIAGMPADVPHFDGNFERIKVDISSCPVPVSVGDKISFIQGQLGASGGEYTVYPSCPYMVTTTAAAIPLPDRTDNEFTVATFNMLDFGTTGDTTGREVKASLAIRTILKSPDMIGVEELKDLATLQALATKIGSDGGPSYSAVMVATSGAQRLGLLYRGDRVNVSSSQEVGGNLQMDNTNHTGQTPVFDRPPLVVMAKITPGTPTEIPVTLFINHLKSLIGVDTNDASGDFVRRKRQLGAEALAGFLAQHQTAGENVISIGDYNAYSFNDGYVDVLGTVIGKPTSSDQVLMSSSDLVNPDLIDLATAAPGTYSYVENGNAQTLDHIVVTSGLTAAPYHLEPAHINADFAESLSTDYTRAERVSDHDPVVAYFTLPSVTPAPEVTLSANSLAFGDQIINTISDAKTVTLTNSGNAALTLSIDKTGADFNETNDCPASLDPAAHCTFNVTFAPATTGAKQGSVTVTDNTANSPHSITFTGNGTPVSAPAVTLSPTSLDFGDQLVGSISTGKTVTLTNSGTATLNITSITPSAPFSETHTCGATLAASENCTITVMFSPVSPLAVQASITIIDDATGSPRTVALTGNGTAPSIKLSATALDFVSQAVGTTSTSKSITVTNDGTADLVISNIVKTDAGSDFTSTNTCTAAVTKNNTCTITVTFAPKSIGTKSAMLSITDNAANSPHTVTLSGSGTDFSVAPSTGGSTNATVNAGQPATYNLQVAGTDGFTGTANFTCTGAPDQATCTISPTSAPLNGTTPANVAVTVTTTAAGASAAGFQSASGSGNGLPIILGFIGLGMIVITPRTGKKQLRYVGACATLLIAVALSGCGSTKHTTTQPGTPSGTYTLTFTATVNGVAHNQSLTLKVN